MTLDPLRATWEIATSVLVMTLESFEWPPDSPDTVKERFKEELSYRLFGDKDSFLEEVETC